MDFSFVQITDHHLGDTENELLHGYSTAYAFRKTLRHIAEHVSDNIDFIVTTGDIVENPSATSYQNFASMTQLQPISSAPGPALVSIEGLHNTPMYFLPGNHDDRDHFFRHLFSQTPPTPLMNASFQHKGTQFICLDWGPGGKAIPHPELLDFLAQCLQNNLPSIIFTHHHLVPVGARWIDSFQPDDNTAFWQLVSQHQVLAIISGHAHVTYEQRIQNIPVLGLRSTSLQFVLQDEPLPCIQPLHYRVVHVRNNLLTTEIVEVQL